ncbi:YcaO-like family protein [Anaeromyxobacter diazotrophicus]|uniref:YcaO domain-containing protein n=1 Tax=Anaeromyxobacter diazotrophicus TaxID=2590199 RepID=A0A7I9VGR9_9BACT|nr:YcaO-like family protein [Anaeromyxobacter diazotrophicus]GEJ55330.1 hypothetical protein AMYX_00710 [Anaeromyxobacter diazotrophicus]
MPGTASRPRRDAAPPVPARLARALGVTRVARVTDLDRAGVEVACAVRPAGHVLQVTNGKGLRFEDAARGALLEAAELACAEAVETSSLRWASADELAARGEAHLAPADLGGAAAGGLRLAWRGGVDLLGSQSVLVPAAAVQAPPQGGPALGLAGLRWTSNGMGAHPSREAALAHALLEAAERHALAQALPEGWDEEACARFRLAAPARRAPRAAGLARQLAGRGLDAHLFQLPTELGLPLAAALLFDREEGPVPLTAGYACRPDLAGAALAALLEAAQSRLTDIHGAREDVGPADRSGAERLRRACGRGGREADRDRGGDLDRDADRDRGGDRDTGQDRGSVRALLAHLRRAGFDRAVAVELAPEALGVHVVKVLVPGFACSELL